MKLAELITSKDGSLSYTKLAACTGHLVLASSFIMLTWKNGFIGEMWMIYAGFTVGHASYAKTLQIVKSIKDKGAENAQG